MKGSFVFSFRLPNEFNVLAKQNKESVREEVIKLLRNLKELEQEKKWEHLWEEDKQDPLDFESSWSESSIQNISKNI